MIPSLDDKHAELPPSEIIKRIEEALAIEGSHTWDDVQEKLVRGDAQIFWNEHGAWITEIIVTPQKRWLNVWVIAGQLPEVMELQEKAHLFCLSHGLADMVAMTRPGWLALSEKPGWEEFGWRQHGVVLRRSVEGV